MNNHTRPTLCHNRPGEPFAPPFKDRYVIRIVLYERVVVKTLAARGFLCYNTSMKRRTPTTKKKPTMRFRQSLFWDVDPKTIDPKRHAVYIAERVMDFGNDREARWLLATYRPQFLKEIAQQSRVLRSDTRALWTKLPQSK